MQNNNILARIARGNLVLQILAGIVFGVVLAMVSPSAAQDAGLLGSLFVGALKAAVLCEITVREVKTHNVHASIY